MGDKAVLLGFRCPYHSWLSSNCHPKPPWGSSPSAIFSTDSLFEHPPVTVEHSDPEWAVQQTQLTPLHLQTEKKKTKKPGVSFPDTCGNVRACLQKPKSRVRWHWRLKCFFILPVMAFPFLVFYNTFLSHDLESENPSPSFSLFLSCSMENPCWIPAPQFKSLSDDSLYSGKHIL